MFNMFPAWTPQPAALQSTHDCRCIHIHTHVRMQTVLKNLVENETLKHFSWSWYNKKKKKNHKFQGYLETPLYLVGCYLFLNYDNNEILSFLNSGNVLIASSDQTEYFFLFVQKHYIGHCFARTEEKKMYYLCSQ